jgi:hypothetical protein
MVKADNKAFIPQPPALNVVPARKVKMTLPAEYKQAVLALGPDFLDRIKARIDEERKNRPPGKRRRKTSPR